MNFCYVDSDATNNATTVQSYECADTDRSCTYLKGLLGNTDFDCKKQSVSWATSTSMCVLHAPVCDTNASIVNQEKCICGNTYCAANQYCYEPKGLCQNSAITNICDNGANSGDCTCGSNDCTTDTGLNCDLATSRCYGDGCANKNGTVANPKDCQCGDVICKADEKGYCWGDASMCANTTNSFAIYEKRTSGACGDTKPYTATSWLAGQGEEKCKDAFEFFDIEPTEHITNVDRALTEGKTYHAAPLGCIHGSKWTRYWYETYPENVYYNTDDYGVECGNVYSSNPLWDRTFTCVCGFSGPLCQNGLNTEDCICGQTSACTRLNPTCDRSTGICSKNGLSNCANGNGTIPSTGTCTCGSNVCYEDEFCIASTSQCVQNQVCPNTDGTVDNLANLTPYQTMCADGTTTVKDNCGTCSNSTYNSKTNCESMGTCSNGSPSNQSVCETVGTCSDTSYAAQSNCEANGSCLQNTSIATKSTCEATTLPSIGYQLVSDPPGQSSCQHDMIQDDGYNHLKALALYKTQYMFTNGQCDTSAYTNRANCPERKPINDAWCLKVGENPDGSAIIKPFIWKTHHSWVYNTWTPGETWTPNVWTSDWTLACQCDGACTESTGFFCNDNTCSKKPKACANTNRQIATTHFCSCLGDESCSTGQYCESNGKCYGDLAICTITDGVRENNENCKCGTSNCDSSTGLICDITNNQCKKETSATLCPISQAAPGENCICGTNVCLTGKYCDVATSSCKIPNSPVTTACKYSDGFNENDAACICGNSICDAGTGRICYAHSSTCSANRITAPTATTAGQQKTIYPLVTSGQCSDHGYSDVTTISDCITGVRGRVKTIIQRSTQRNRPLYCYKSYGFYTGGFNSYTGGFNSGAGTKGWKGGWNEPYFYYEPSDWAGVSSGCSATYPCVCKVTKPVCQITHGYYQNTEDCTCGDTLCDSSTGRYCNSGVCSQTAKPTGACPNNDGTVANVQQCHCNSEECDINEYCHFELAQCSKTSTFLVGLLPVSTCTTQDGSSTNNEPCLCGNQYCSRGQLCTAGTCSDNICQNTTGAHNNSASCICGDAQCAAGDYCYSNRSLCNANAKCPHVNGYVTNNQKCMCGTNTCDADVYCTFSSNTCSNTIGTCANTDGSSVNAQQCGCGSSICDASKGLYCDATADGRGGCSTIPGRHSTTYYEVTSGTCASNNYAVIKSKAACSTAAAMLSRTDNSVVDLDYGNQMPDNISKTYPAGCMEVKPSTDYVSTKDAYYNWHPSSYWSHQDKINFRDTVQLRWNSNVTTSTVCNATGTAVDSTQYQRNFQAAYVQVQYSSQSCLCKGTSPACPNVNGESPNIAICTCGVAALKSTCQSDQYCDALNAKCRDYGLCENTTGFNANSASCLCGNEDCTAGQYCDSEKNQCLDKPYCSNKNGIVVNTNQCRCGDTNCEAGERCYASINQCSSTANFKAFQFNTKDSCDIVGGYKWINLNSTCELAGKTLGRKYTSLTSTSFQPLHLGPTNPQNKVQGCVYEFGNPPALQQRYGSPTNNTQSCSGNQECLCWKNMTSCSNGEGQDVNSNECLCGSSPCSVNQYCHRSTSTCSSSNINICSNTNGVYPNQAQCFCGKQECSTGQYCLGNICSTDKPICVEDGITQNDFTCKCGAEECSVDEYCDGVQCRAQPLCSSDITANCTKKTAFIEISNGNCIGNSYQDLDENECSVTSTEIFQWADTNLLTLDFSTNTGTALVAPGCSKTLTGLAGDILFNTDTDSSINCGTDNSAVCLCKKEAPSCTEQGHDEDCYCNQKLCTSTTGRYCLDNVCRQEPPCAQQNGDIENNEDCSCGTNVCNSASGRYCVPEDNSCSATQLSVCPYTNGKYNNDGKIIGTDCQCGNTKCNSTSGFYCIASENKCSTRPVCEYQDGRRINTDVCECGSETCNDATPFCNQGTCLPIFCSNTDATVENGDDCQCGSSICESASARFCDGNNCWPTIQCANDGQQLISSNCTCGTNACTVGEYCIDYQCSPNPECADKTGTYVVGTTCQCSSVNSSSGNSSSVNSCNQGQFCYSDGQCKSTGNCVNTNRLKINNAACNCGSAPCGSGSYCGNNTCYTTPLCGNSDGSINNTDTCLCDTTQCNSTTGFFCDRGVCQQFETCERYNQTSTKCMCGVSECPVGHYCFQRECFANDLCTNTNGTVANGADCTCVTDIGLETCDASTGLFCNSTHGCTGTTDVCDAAAKSACSNANKEDCSPGATTCGGCKTGFKVDGAACAVITCTCGPGQEVDSSCTGSADATCQTCATGKYSSDAGACVACATGYTTNGQTGQSSCEFCDKGYGGDQSVCGVCPIHTYNNVTSLAKTSPCTDHACPLGQGVHASFNTTTQKETQTSCEACDGTGEYSDSATTGQCQTCGAGTEPNVGRTACVDTTPPVITILGTTPMIIDAGTTYNDAGATCDDAVDGFIVPTSNSTVNTTVLGSYTVTYNCMDSSGNIAASAVRVVDVRVVDVLDTLPNCPTNKIKITATCSCGIGACSAGDYCDGGTCKACNIENTNGVCSTCAEAVSAYQCGSFDLKLQYYHNCV